MAAENKPEDDHGNSNGSHVKIFLPKKLLECLPKCSSLPKERHRWNTNEALKLSTQVFPAVGQQDGHMQTLCLDSRSSLLLVQSLRIMVKCYSALGSWDGEAVSWELGGLWMTLHVVKSRDEQQEKWRA
ncbi:hypothetical protein DUI87_31919 [Hirundo rustica rustica]|uniref:Calmodulin-binding transcription activator 1 n=1 Tax=Hirundo rustica rustica TaxID=333673 RepID=A0A3M0IYV3_HIRRU|nr:hypothetical protein DUI87_31919 [Hirundo rustica rustica]